MFPKPERTKSKKTLKQAKLSPCVVCRSPNTDPCHIRSKGAGGPDAEWNIIPMCREHHQEQHRLGWGFTQGYDGVWRFLKAHGWEWVNGKLWNDKLKGLV